MSNLNKVLLMGRLTRDPELRYTPQGTALTEIGLAINREWGGGREGGERQKETTFVDVTVWQRRAEVICQYLRKGDPIFIEGRLSLDTWETKEGDRRSKLRVVADNFQFVGGRSERQGGGSSSYDEERPTQRGATAPYPEYEYQAGGGGSSSRGGPEGGDPLDDSEIPF